MHQPTKFRQNLAIHDRVIYGQFVTEPHSRGSVSELRGPNCTKYRENIDSSSAVSLFVIDFSYVAQGQLCLIIDVKFRTLFAPLELWEGWSVTDLAAHRLLAQSRHITLLLVACPVSRIRLSLYLHYIHSTISHFTSPHIHLSACNCPHATPYRLPQHATSYILAMQLSTAPASTYRDDWPFSDLAPPLTLTHRAPSSPQICINILSRYRTSYSRRIILCSHG